MSFILLGYCLELIGALYLAKSIVTRGVRQIAEEATLKYAYNYSQIRSLSESKIDSLLGVSSLIIGFSLQTISSFINTSTLGLLNCLLALFLYLLFTFMISKKVSVVYSRCVAKEIFRKHKNDWIYAQYPGEQPILDFGSALQLKREEGESIEDYRNRIWSHIEKDTFGETIIKKI